MAKISPVSAKYIIHSSITIEGVVDRPDVIGAIFGQTEGLVGSELELRELQRSGRIGRIEVNLETKNGKTSGDIVIPSSLDKAETSIIGASLEIIQRIGPCNARVKVEKIEDVRISKRSMVIDRAKELLRTMMDLTMPDSQELADEVTAAVRVMEIQTYGKERLPAGPAVEESDEVMIVEGRADVINLLKYGFKNAIAMNGTSVPDTIKELSKKKTIIAFLDGDRGGDLILKELFDTTEFDFVARAPDGKEVEELTKKEIHKALRGKIAAEQAKLELGSREDSREHSRTQKRDYQNGRRQRQDRQQHDQGQRKQYEKKRQADISSEDKEKFKGMIEDLIGTKAVFFVDENINILGKVPLSELESTLKDINETYALVIDETITRDMIRLAKAGNVACIVGLDKKTQGRDEDHITVLTASEL
ncbi:MAG: DNA primase DnaG [Candidatus Woesearchaeota archaeon]